MFRSKIRINITCFFRICRNCPTRFATRAIHLETRALRIFEPEDISVCGYHQCHLCVVIISVCYVFPIVPFGFLLTWKSKEVWASWKRRDSINRFVSFFAEKDKMFSRFSETAKNSPFAAPFSVAKCSSQSTPAPRRTRIMASPNTDGRFQPAFLYLRSLVYLAILEKSFLNVML